MLALFPRAISMTGSSVRRSAAKSENGYKLKSFACIWNLSLTVWLLVMVISKSASPPAGMTVSIALIVMPMSSGPLRAETVILRSKSSVITKSNFRIGVIQAVCYINIVVLFCEGNVFIEWVVLAV